LPARQSVTRRFRARRRKRVADGAAHAEVAREEETSRYQVSRAHREGFDELMRRRPLPIPEQGQCLASVVRRHVA
jgi:hypothetical protein